MLTEIICCRALCSTLSIRLHLTFASVIQFLFFVNVGFRKILKIFLFNRSITAEDRDSISSCQPFVSIGCAQSLGESATRRCAEFHPVLRRSVLTMVPASNGDVTTYLLASWRQTLCNLQLMLIMYPEIKYGGLYS